MKTFILLASLLVIPATSEASAVRPDTVAGQRLVHKLADKASEAFVSQSEAGSADDSSCDSLKDELLESISQLELKGSKAADDLLLAKLTLEKGACSKNLFAVTVYLRSADSVN